MNRFLKAFCCVLLWSWFPSAGLHAQEGDTQKPPAVASPPLIIPSYPDSPTGLEHLAKDIMKAQRENESALADALLKSLLLPEPRDWYDRVFGGDLSEESEAIYEQSSGGLVSSLARLFLDAAAKEMTDIRAVRYEKSCDDNSGEDTFGILNARLEAVPLYELRFMKGNSFLKVFAFVYVNGGFHFVLLPRLDGRVFGSSNRSLSPQRNKEEHKDPPPESSKHVTVGGNVQAAKLIHRVQPIYPVTAREEHLQGTVTMHALIGKDGAIRGLYVVKGSCSLAKAAYEAVRQWRYTPTILMGQPVEVDTVITVIYQLAR
jgi:hypothetical protein